MIILETKRLFLEEASIDDSDFFFDLLNSPNWIKYIGDRSIHTKKDAVHYIERSLIKSYRERGFGLYKMVLKEQSIPIGICGLVQRDYLKQPDIGFAVLPEFEGKGYTTEASQGVLEWASQSLQLSALYAITTHPNKRSQALLKKLGLKEQGTIRPNSEDPEYLLFYKKLKN